MLKAINADLDEEKVRHSRKLRAGRGKMRRRNYRQRRGPLIVHSGESNIISAFRCML